MTKIYIQAIVDEANQLTLPALAMRGLGYFSGDTVSITIPACDCTEDCECAELLLLRTCENMTESGYTSEGDVINIPPVLLAAAGLNPGTACSVLSTGEVLLIAAAATPKLQQELTDELSCLLEELEHDPDVVATVPPSIRF
jgi:antitoxin component of MazEF toxin-antitoxin module